MDDVAFTTAYNEWQKSIPFSDAEAYNKLNAHLIAVASPEHAPKREGGYMTDAVSCACEWKSNTFYDGYEYAMREWRDHVMQQIRGDEFNG